LEEHEAIAIHARWLAGFRGMRDNWRLIKKYPSDPWTRVNESVNFGFERYTIPAIRGEDISELYWKDELADRLPLDEREAHEFARHVLSPQHMEAELSALPWAWQSAIKIQSDAGNGVPVTMDMETFMSWFKAVARSCRFPGHPPA
jgi:hypothetical protein